ncbi:progestin and adipoQ receptor family member 3-like [Ornithodoros turicata]|uniref:progestin and adipoQ receptor family member 3-like n=1 Tax=Ornithodoros turicata TaxID=34597 RepID=UPI0031386ED1
MTLEHERLHSDDDGPQGDAKPAYIPHRPFIHSGYRSCRTVKECFRSIIQWNNETLNIWTHLLGAVVFVGVLAYDTTVRFKQYNIADITDRLLIVSVLCVYMATMLVSVAYHTFNCLSRSVYDVLLWYDFAAVGASIGVTVASGLYLAFSGHPYLQALYLSIEGIIFIAAMPKLTTDPSRHLCAMIVFTVIPTMHWFYLSTPSSHVLFPRIIALFMFSGTTYVIFEKKIPESSWPGTFDHVGSSHQIWHVMVVVLTMCWHETSLEFVKCNMKLTDE